MDEKEQKYEYRITYEWFSGDEWEPQSINFARSDSISEILEEVNYRRSTPRIFRNVVFQRRPRGDWETIPEPQLALDRTYDRAP